MSKNTKYGKARKPEKSIASFLSLGKGIKEMKYPRGGRRATKPKRGVRGRKSVGRRRQSVRRAKQGLPKRQHLQSNLGGLTLTRFAAAQRPNAVAATIKRAGQPNFINITYPGMIKGDGGQQQFGSWWLNCGNDLRRIWASIQAEYVAKNSTTKAEFVSSLPGGAGNYPNLSFRYVLESATSQLYLANTSGTPQNIELYDIVMKRDSGQVGFDISGWPIGSIGGRPGTEFITPETAWYLGMKNQQSNASGFGEVAFVEKVEPYNLGATPYQSKLFKDYFKVVRKTNVSLPIGGQHKHFVDLKPNRIIDGDMLSQNSVFKGLSFFTLVVASGVPVVRCPDTNPEHTLANPLGDTSTSAVSVSVIQQVKYKWTWVEDSRENIYRANYVNVLNGNTAQSVQPALCKLQAADLTVQSVVSGITYPNLPSECTRDPPPAEALKADCGC